MARFPFNQPEKTKDCGYRCLYYGLDLVIPYEQWLLRFEIFNPVAKGITFSDICTVFEYYKRDYKFTQLTESGLFIIYSGSWLKHGHYFCYDNGIVLCSTKSEPERIPLDKVVERLEAKSVEGAFRCLQVLGKVVTT